MPFLSIENQLIYQLQKPLRQRFLQYFWSPYLKKWNIPLIYLKNWKSLFLFEEIEFPIFIWRNWKSIFYLKKLKVPFLFEEMKVLLFYLKKWKSLFLFEEIEYPFFIWRYWKSFNLFEELKVPLIYLKNWKSLFLFEEIEFPFFIWRNEIPLFYLKAFENFWCKNKLDYWAKKSK